MIGFGFGVRCPVTNEVEKARRRAAELGIKLACGVLLYIAEQLEAYAASMDKCEDNERIAANFRDAAAQCVEIAKAEGAVSQVYQQSVEQMQHL